jgi:sugar lactone lactonase YvrE
MKPNSVRSTTLLAMLALSLLGIMPVDAASIDKIIVFAKGTDVGGTGPDSLTIANNNLWVAYTNGADSTGASGRSWVVVYDMNGNALRKYSLAGYVDGLRYDAERNVIWALQNQDGNSTLTFIDPLGTTLGSTNTYAVASSSQGYDDVAFLNGQIFMSYTNPVNPSDPTIQSVNQPSQILTSTAPISVTTVLTMGATGTNLATGATNQPTADSDSDSLVLTPQGALMLTSGNDGQLIFVENPGKSNQAVSFLQLIDPNAGANATALDDAVFVTTPAGTFYVADTGNNRVLQVDVSDLDLMSLYASVGSMNVVGNVDLKSGVVTPLLTNVSSPHGLLFVPRFTSLFGHYGNS